ncbi:MAG: hypothetical protein FWD28_00765 [Treponema sp.]|nr:hypothetical protein [Treponema sp.]
MNKNKIFIISVLVLAVVIAVVLLVHSFSDHDHDEIFSAGGQTVRLSDDGTFSARLAHGVRKEGTYIKTPDDTRTIVAFSVNGRTEIGLIENDRLHLPHEWDDGHGHGNILPKADLSPSRDRHNGHSH